MESKNDLSDEKIERIIKNIFYDKNINLENLENLETSKRTLIETIVSSGKKDGKNQGHIIYGLFREVEMLEKTIEHLVNNSKNVSIMYCTDCGKKLLSTMKRCIRCDKTFVLKKWKFNWNQNRGYLVTSTILGILSLLFILLVPFSEWIMNPTINMVSLTLVFILCLVYTWVFLYWYLKPILKSKTKESKNITIKKYVPHHKRMAKNEKELKEMIRKTENKLKERKNKIERKIQKIKEILQ